jgi:RNA recognition motif-containing protein
MTKFDLPPEISEEEVKKVFETVGEIISVKLNRKMGKDINGESVITYCFGYILYDNVEAAKNAIKKFDDTNIFGTRPLKVELWVSKDELESEKKLKEEKQLKNFFSELMSQNVIQRYRSEG